MWSRAATEAIALALAEAFLGGEWTRAGLRARARDALGRHPRWLDLVVRAALDAYRDRPSDRPRELHAFLSASLRELDRHGRLTVRPPRAERVTLAAPDMGRRRWPVPEIRDLRELASFLTLREGELDWLADVRGLERTVKDERLRNYRYTWVARAGGRPRLIEQPKRLLKDAQRRVLHDILGLIPPHHAAHGFRRGHSAFTNARRHVGQKVVLSFDLEDFFASVTAAHVYGIFRTAGYPELVAHRMTALCTNTVPDSVASGGQWRLRRALATPHLPQGAPTSPALANLAALALDRRIGALAVATGARYSRYADDIALSGDGWLLDHAEEVRRQVAAIVRESGFRLNERKSRLTTNAGRQRVTGVVVNERTNAPRREYDLLRAVLHNAARHGAAAANRDGNPDFRAHLRGRIAWIGSLNAGRARKLERLWAAIDWES